ncbi:MAG: type II toxin-antitoxin system prevent-host-death family antitoxin [Alphaproteobacteria bacterium]|nr:type II toxin-antitoxin system prevent-host-death family antitoxin [Alphaproteobacteria bacterium]
MSTVNMLDAKTNLSRLVEAVESGREKEIVIARNGRPAARLVPIETAAAGRRIGIAKGKFVAPEPDSKLDAEIAKRFTGR